MILRMLCLALLALSGGCLRAALTTQDASGTPPARPKPAHPVVADTSSLPVESTGTATFRGLDLSTLPERELALGSGRGHAAAPSATTLTAKPAPTAAMPAAKPAPSSTSPTAKPEPPVVDKAAARRTDEAATPERKPFLRPALSPAGAQAGQKEAAPRSTTESPGRDENPVPSPRQTTSARDAALNAAPPAPRPSGAEAGATLTPPRPSDQRQPAAAERPALDPPPSTPPREALKASGQPGGSTPSAVNPPAAKAPRESEPLAAARRADPPSPPPTNQPEVVEAPRPAEEAEPEAPAPEQLRQEEEESVTPAQATIPPDARFQVQIMSTSDPEQAEEMRQQALLVFPGEHVEVVWDPPNYKVRVGALVTQEAAVDLKRRALRLGFQNAWVVPRRQS